MLSSSERGPDSARVRGRDVAVAALAAFLWIFVSLLPLRAIPRAAEEAPGLDAHIYIAMAESPSVFTMPPFGYRIGAPLLARLLPLPLEAAFFTVTALSLLAVSLFAYLLLREWGFDHELSLLGLGFVAAAPEVTRFLNNYFLVDAAAVAGTALLLLGIERRWSSGAMAFLLLIASLVKETAFFVLPVLYLRLALPRLVDGRAAAQTLLVALPALASAFWLRLGWGGASTGFPYLTPWSVPRRAWFGSYVSYQDIWVNLFGFLGLLAAANAFTAEGRAFLRRYWPYLALVLAQLIVPRNSDRLLFFAFPVVIPLALLELLRMKDSLSDWFPLLGTLLVFCYLFLPGQLAFPIGLVLLSRLLLEWRRGREA
ncbi:MAG: hypothetical protein ACRD21_01195 [Vicinamibacteria bacterium]